MACLVIVFENSFEKQVLRKIVQRFVKQMFVWEPEMLLTCFLCF